MIQIYNALYNDLGQIVIVCPHTINKNLYLRSNDIKLIFDRYLCSHGHSTIFVLDGQAYNKKINIQVDDFDAEYINIHQYESCKELLLMSTIIRNEDEYIIQWIEYHTILGVDKFIIYDNSVNKDANPKSGHLLGKGKNSNLQELLSIYVNSGRVIMLDWPFEEKFQQTHQNHSIWAFKSAKYIGFFDVDEYVNPQLNYFDIFYLIENYLSSSRLNYNSIGGVRLANRDFYNPFKKEESKYYFLSIYNTVSKFKIQRGKSFIVPSNVKCFSIHEITMGEKLYDIDRRFVYFNHYLFLNKFNRGRSVLNITWIRDKSIQRIAKMLNSKDVLL